jgi:hypothetical protein
VLAACDLFSIELLVKGKLVRYMVFFALHVATRKIEPQHEGCHGEIICIERLGGLLKPYHRKAA